MAPTSAVALTQGERAALGSLLTELGDVFGTRLQSLVAYETSGTNLDRALHTLALVERLTFEDLARCLPLVDGWNRRALHVPLLLTPAEFRRTLDVFPLEYGEIIAKHVIIAGADPFAGAHVADADRRRACEQQAKSHLIHLREGFLENGRNPRNVEWLIARSVPAFRRLLANITRLNGIDTSSDEDLAAAAERTIGIPGSLVSEVFAFPTAGTVADHTALLTRYISATERIWAYVDEWRQTLRPSGPRGGCSSPCCCAPRSGRNPTSRF
jgi:hypothetical protein